MKDFSMSFFNEHMVTSPSGLDFQGGHCPSRTHQIVNKDYYRLLKMEKTVLSDQKLKQSKVSGNPLPD
jgi:hypothetical protein